MTNLKRTPLYYEHLKLGAKMVPFSGWELPLQYSGIIDEHLTVRNKVGIFDVSHMGEFFISGEKAPALLQKLIPQDISKLKEGKAVYSQLLNPKGGIVDDLIIYRMPDKDEKPYYFLIVNASRIENDFSFIETNLSKTDDIKITNVSDDYALIAVQGPLSKGLINDIGLKTDNQPQRFSIKETSIGGIDILISATGYTGENGVDILVKNENASQLWNKLLQEGEKYGLKPIGLGARDTLRLEASLLLYGQDINEETTCIEAGLDWSISRDKKDNYLGKDVILSQIHGENIRKKLVGFKMLDNAIPRHNCDIYKNNQTIGIATSGGIGPFIKSNIGLAYINPNFCREGEKIEVKIREKLHPAIIVKTPFYKRKDRN